MFKNNPESSDEVNSQEHRKFMGGSLTNYQTKKNYKFRI